MSPLALLSSMTSPFSRQLVARFTRPCIPYFCRTLPRPGYALVVQALVATLPASIQDDVLPSSFDSSHSQARRMELPRAHVTRASRIDRTRAGRNVAVERDELTVP